MARLARQRYDLIAIDSVRPHPDNPRQGNIERIVESIHKNGFYGTLLVQESTSYILAGNHRWVAANEAGIQELPGIILDVDDETARRILIADNRLSDVASWDNAALVDMLEELSLTGDELAGTGFTLEELAELRGDSFEPDDEPPNRLDERKPVECPNCGHEWVPE